MLHSAPHLKTGDLYAMVATELFGLSQPSRPRIGLELELLAVVRGADGVCRQVPVDADGGIGLGFWMESLAREQGWQFGSGEEGNPSVVIPDGGTITLEPAGQIEYSGPPFERNELALKDLDRVVEILARSAAESGIELVTIGFNTLVPDSDLGLVVRKARYTLMDRYFAAIGEHGRLMMRATCALQINLDFGTAAETPGRWRLANMIAPSLNAIFANSPAVVDGHRYRSYRHEIWRHADPSRTGRLFDSPDLDPVDDYLSFALHAGVIFQQQPDASLVAPPSPMSFLEWMNGASALRPPDMDDWRRHLSTLFPDVRARGYMELRSIDALPSPVRDVAVAMVSTLIYTQSLRNEAIARLEGRHRVVDPQEPEHGGCWQSDYQTGKELLELCLPFIAEPRLARLAALYLEQVVRKGLTPGELDGNSQWFAEVGHDA